MGALISIITDKLFPPAPDTTPLDPSLVYLVTGGLTGIGYQTTLKLAQRGATVFVTARTIPRAQASLAQLETDVPEVKGRVKLVESAVDLSSFEEAKQGGQAVVEAIEASGGRLDAVCLNAARVAVDGPYEIGENGFELIVGTNYFGNHIFLEELLPLLEKRAKEPDSDVRLIYIGSQAQEFVPTTWKLDGAKTLNSTFASSEKSINNLRPRLTRYGLSKVLAHLYVIELQARLDARNLPIIAIVVHPGSVATEKNYASFPVPRWLIDAIWISPENGAWTQLFLLTNKEVRRNASKWQGKYVIPYGKIVSAHWKGGDDPVLARQLWEYTEEVMKRGRAEQ